MSKTRGVLKQIIATCPFRTLGAAVVRNMNYISLDSRQTAAAAAGVVCDKIQLLRVVTRMRLAKYLINNYAYGNAC